MIGRRSIIVGGALAAAAGLGLSGWSRTGALARVYTGTVPGVAVSGYDPVAYSLEGAPRMGMSGLTLRHDGAEWWFATEHNRAAFAADPDRYAPRFGGYCAYAVAGGGTAGAAPDHWQIVDGRLYLNASRRVHAKWQLDPAGYIARAEQHWPRLLRS